MNFFKPAEIRAILVLSILVFLGSSLTLLKRQGKLSSLNLETFLDNSRYNYSYRVSDLPQKEKSENAKTEVADQRINEEPDIELEILDLNSAGFFELQHRRSSGRNKGGGKGYPVPAGEIAVDIDKDRGH